MGGETGDKIKIADFGLSKDFNQAALATSCGTPGYVAPEVLSGEPYDHAVDIWSVGVITYVILCGYTPFYSEDQRELFQQILKADYSYPSPEWDDISKEAKDFIDSMLKQNPASRISATEALKHPWLAGNAPQRQLSSFQSFRSLLADTAKTDKKNRG